MFLLLLVHLVLVFTVSASNAATDVASLLAFKSGITYDPRRVMASWNQTVHHCRWPGVTCGGKRHPDRVVRLTLSSLALAGLVRPEIGNLTFLRHLNLSGNNFYGSIPLELCGGTSQLHHLDLQSNSFEGTIPSTLGRCPRLQFLRLGSNQLAGAIPPSISNCSQLTALFLGINSLKGEIPPPLGNLSSLTTISLSQNNLTGVIPSSFSNLKSLKGFNVEFNQLTGTIPSFLYNLSTIEGFSVSMNHFHGTIPSNIGSLLPNLRVFDMYLNQFTGPIPASLCNASGIDTLQLDSNDFSGTLPNCLGSLQNLVALTLYNNSLVAKNSDDWSFLTSLTNCSNLQVLLINSNRFEGFLPQSITNLSTNLYILSLGGSAISGSIPQDIGNLVSLQVLEMAESNLGGEVPNSIGKLQYLLRLYLSGNRLVGHMPEVIYNLTNLNELFMERNGFEGRIPAGFRKMQSLASLTLYSNNFDGEIPKDLLTLQSITKLFDLSYNNFSGSLPSEIGSLNNLVTIDISNNRLSGGIPTALGECVMLAQLYMESNLFEGTIPQSLANLKTLEIVDMSMNHLSGAIPPSLSKFRFLSYLNLSFNDLQGEVPRAGIFQNASLFSVKGNGKLCGGVAELQLPPCSSVKIQPPPIKAKHEHEHKVVVIVVCVLVGSLLLLGFLAFFYWKKKSMNGASSPTSVDDMKNPKVRVSYAELYKATDGFSSASFVGAGSFGSVYTGVVESIGAQVAVKVFNLQQRGALKSFMSECEALRNIRHRNLVKILTACSSIDFKGNSFKALVYEFVPNGSLDKWLHQSGSRNLRLIQRLNIAIDVATALNYLHNHGENPIIHCDLKPSNILLNNDMTAYVGDFGLAKILLNDGDLVSQSQSNSWTLKGTIGYVPPEYGMGLRISTEGDVFTYGILLLEMITGRSPTDDTFGIDANLYKFVSSAFPQEMWTVIDPSFSREVEIEEENEDANTRGSTRRKTQECLASMIICGLSCSKESPTERLSVKDVLKELFDARDKLLASK